jgi:hypothetical protein
VYPMADPSEKKAKEAEKYASRAAKAQESAAKKELKPSTPRGSNRWSFRSFSRGNSKTIDKVNEGGGSEWEEEVEEAPAAPTIVDKVKHSIAKATGHPSAFPPPEPRKRRFGGEIFVKLSGRGEPKPEVRPLDNRFNRTTMMP